MSLGSELRELSAEISTEEIFSSIETTIRNLASNKEKGCKIKFSGIGDDQICEIYKKLEKEEISVDKKAGVIYWNEGAIVKKRTLSPCITCDPNLHLACWGCKEIVRWEKEKETTMSYNVHSSLKVSVTQDGRSDCTICELK